MSTIGHESIERIAALRAAHGIACVDSPVSGGPDSARAGNLTLLAAGAPEAVAAVKPWQLRIGKKVFVMGDRPGQAQVMKLPMWILEQAARVWRFAMIQGAGNQDVTAIARVMESWAGVEVRRETQP